MSCDGLFLEIISGKCQCGKGLLVCYFFWIYLIKHGFGGDITGKSLIFCSLPGILVEMTCVGKDFGGIR